MPRPTARVLAMLELLQGGGTRTVADLSEQLGVDGRTVRRYVEHLRALDIPVDSVRGRYGGYRLARHYRMPPLMLTDEEALAVVWALLLSLRSQSGPVTAMAAHSATAKVRRVLPAPLARRIEAVLETVDFIGAGTGFSSDDTEARGRGARTLMSFAEAIRDRRPVVFTYTPREGQESQRHVEPHGLVVHRSLLYLTGFDVDRQALRTFRLDRIADLHLQPGSFTVSPDSEPTAQVAGPLSAVPWRHEVSLLVRADIAYVRTRIPDTLASITPVSTDSTDSADSAGWLRVFLRAERLEWVAGTLAMLDRPFVIEEPPALREVVAVLGRRLVRDARTRSTA